MGRVLSWIDPDRAFSSVAYHKGLLIAPASFDFGGGIGQGAMVAYDVDDPENPVNVFDSRDYPDVYHADENGAHYLGDLGEMHALYFHKDLLYLTDRGKSRNGFLILDLGPLYDGDPKTIPQVVSRYYFPGVEKSTVYDGFSFSPVWVGGRYVFAPTGSTGLFVIDTGDLGEPTLLAHLTKEQLHNQVLRSAHAIGDLLVLSPAAIASATGDMVLLDVSDPSQPNILNRHTIKIGYQGILYGSRFYNGAFTGNRNTDEISEIIAYELSDPLNIEEIILARTDKFFKPEYVYVRDDELYVGHYPGLTRWTVDNDVATLKATVEPQLPPADDYAFVSPLGNLTVLTSDHNVQSKISIGVGKIEKDTSGPKIKYVRPTPGQTNVSILAKIGLSFSESIDNASLEEGAIVLREASTGDVVDSGLSHGMAIAHLVPDEPLAENTTYEVLVTPKLLDMVGNEYAAESVVSSFSTGETFTAFSSQIIVDTPKPVGDFVKLRATVSNDSNSDSLQYSWNFGDGSADTEFSSDPNIEARFSKPGNYSIMLAVRHDDSGQLVRTTAVQVVHSRLPDTRAVSSSTMILDDESGRLFVVNPDNDSVTALDSTTGRVFFEVSTGDRPVSISRIEDELWVSCRDADSIYIHGAKDGRHRETIALGYGASPHGIVSGGASDNVYVALSATDELQEIDVITHVLTRRLGLDGPLRNIAWVPSKNIVVAPQFMAADQVGARVQWVNLEHWSVEYNKVLGPSLTLDGLSDGRGYPNYLGPIAVDPTQSVFWMPGKKDNLFRGTRRDGKPLTFEHTVRSIAISVSIDERSEILEDRIDLDNSDFASAAAYNGLGNILYLATMGSQTITAIDAYRPQRQSVFNSYGEGPIAIVGDRLATRLYVHNQLSREIAVFSARPDGHLDHLERWGTVGNEALAPDVLAGKRFFNNTTKSHLSREGYMSCASCHIDGSHDGRVWDLSSLGEGFRNTIDLRGKAGMRHGILHWTGNFDEVQDFDDQIVNLNGGTGFLFDVLKPGHRTHFPSKSGLSRDLDNLAKYVTSLSDYPRSPYKTNIGEMTVPARRGRQTFVDLECYECHSGPTFTDSALGLRHDVGTQAEGSGSRLGESLSGFDTPTLIGLWQSGPYLHDGSAASLSEVFGAGGGDAAEAHQRANTLDEAAKSELLAFLMQLDSEDEVTPDDVGSSNRPPVFANSSYQFEYVYRYDERKQRIGRVTAIDPNTEQSLTYRILPSLHSQIFSVDPVTGEFELKFNDLYLRDISNRVLDIERRYEIEISARDDGEFETQAISKVTVEVVYPNLPLENQDLNNFKRLVNSLDTGKPLSDHEQMLLDGFNQDIAQARLNLD